MSAHFSRCISVRRPQRPARQDNVLKSVKNRSKNRPQSHKMQALIDGQQAVPSEKVPMELKIHGHDRQEATLPGCFDRNKQTLTTKATPLRAQPRPAGPQPSVTPRTEYETRRIQANCHRHFMKKEQTQSEKGKRIKNLLRTEMKFTFAEKRSSRCSLLFRSSHLH